MTLPSYLQNTLVYLILFSVFTVGAQNNPSALFDDWVQAQQQDSEPILPNFGFAGYHYGEAGIPSPSHSIFDVTQYGAIPNDNISDKTAVMAAISAAETNGSGIVFFPPGEFLINETTDDIDEVIYIRKGNIILKGSGSGPDGTTLVQNEYTNPTDLEKLYSCPYLIQFRPTYSSRPLLTTISANATRESFSVQVASTSKLKVGDWVSLKLSDNDPTLLASEFFPYAVVPEYTSIAADINTWEFHKIEAISGNTVTFKEPIHKTIDINYNWYLEKITFIEEVGIQDLNYRGGFTQEFEHHRSFQDDSGWSAIQFQMVANGWIYNVHFSDVSNAASIKLSSSCSALMNEYEGNPGHAFISANLGTGNLIGLNKDNSIGVHHNCGVAGSSIGNVLWRNEMPTNGNSGIEIHASQPRANLIDACVGGLGFNYGGAESNQPNHLRHLVVWNFEGIGYTNTNFEFWRNNYTYAKIIPPIVSGLVGFSISEDTSQSISGTDKQYQENESPGVHVDETSLYEAQLSYRLGGLPSWLLDLGKVTGVSIDIPILKITVNQTAQLTATVLPSNAIDKSFSWSSSNESIATVNTNGIVTGVSSGTVQISATTTDGNFVANTQVTVSPIGSPITHIETFENMPFTGWVSDSYMGDNGFVWNIEAKSTAGYIDSSKCIYMRSGKTGVLANNLPGGIGSFSVTCKDLWDAGVERNLQLIINGNVIDNFAHTGTELYTYTVENIVITGDVSIALRNDSSTESNKSIAIDNLTWTTYDEDIAGIENTELIARNIHLFPNPVKNVLQIQSLDSNLSIENIKIYNSIGSLVYNKEATTHILLGNFTRGMYIVLLQTNKGSVTKKLLLN